MRKKQIFVLLIVFAFINVATVSLAFYARGKSSSDIPSYEEFMAERTDGDYVGIDGTDRFVGMIIEEDIEPDTGNTWSVPVINDWTGGWEWLDFDCILSDVHANIWIGLWPDIWDGGHQDRFVADDPTTGEDTWYFAYPWSSIGIDAVAAGAPDPDGDGYYLPPGYEDWITMTNLEEVMYAFESNIHDKVTTTFGMYADRPGPLDDYKIQILIFNIRDGLYYDPVGAGWFTAGYFWSYASNLNDANIFHMDTYQWWRRQGEGSVHYGLDPKPFEYEGTFAHEFQHLVHYDVDSDEYSWVNEGCSTFSEFICGYGVPYGHIGEYFTYYWDVSLVLWGTSTYSGLASYGIVFLWTLYMYEHYGGESLIWDLVHEQENGIAGWSNTLAAHHIRRSFDDIFQDWSTANYIDDTSTHWGRYGYYNIDFPDDSDGITLPMMVYLWNSWYPWFDTYIEGTEYPNAGYAYPFGSSLPYNPTYVEMHPGEDKLMSVDFDGQDVCGVVATSGEYKWYSGGEGWAWYRMGGTFDIPVEGATLNFMNYFDIEADWDFGYVEVHDLTTGEWYTLPGLGTTTSIGYNYGTDNPNCLGLQPYEYYDLGRWNAFTGSSYGWYTETMDLAPFAGHTIELFFTYWTDPYTLGAGMYLDDIEIPELGFTDDVETDTAGWTINAGWHRDNIVLPNDFKVNFIHTMEFYKKNGDLWKIWHYTSRMRVDDETQEGSTLLLMLDNKYLYSYNVMVVANQPGYEHTFGADYVFTVEKWTPHCHWHCKCGR